MGGNWPAPNASTATLGPGGAAVSICDPFFHQDQDRLSDQKAVQNHIQPHVLKLGSGDAGDVFPVSYTHLDVYKRQKLIDGSKHPKRRKFYLIVTLVLMIGELAALKYVRFFLNTAGIISGLFGNRLEFSFTGFLAPLGISYYTLSLVGYVLDVYWEKYPHQRNVFKQLLFACYFPQLTSGPITRYLSLIHI